MGKNRRPHWKRTINRTKRGWYRDLFTDVSHYALRDTNSPVVTAACGFVMYKNEMIPAFKSDPRCKECQRRVDKNKRDRR
jgi:hypothetical protein